MSNQYYNNVNDGTHKNSKPVTLFVEQIDCFIIFKCLFEISFHWIR